jgi:hypothetical protein
MCAVNKTKMMITTCDQSGSCERSAAAYPRVTGLMPAVARQFGELEGKVDSRHWFETIYGHQRRSCISPIIVGWIDGEMTFVRCTSSNNCAIYRAIFRGSIYRQDRLVDSHCVGCRCYRTSHAGSARLQYESVPIPAVRLHQPVIVSSITPLCSVAVKWLRIVHSRLELVPVS